MSRAKAKLVIMHDLQCKQPDWILTKKDCDMIANALAETYGLREPVLMRFHNYLRALRKL